MANELGLSFNSLVNALLLKTIREGGVDLRNPALSENGFTQGFENSLLEADKQENYQSFDSIQAMLKTARK